MKLILRFLMFATFVFAFLLLRSLLGNNVEILKIAVKPDSYLVDGKRETLANVIEMFEAYKGKGFEICLEFEASPERLEAITDRIRDIEFKSKSFISARACN